MYFSGEDIRNRVHIGTLTESLRPGVQWLQNPQSYVYSFTTWLQQIISVKNFAFERLQTFVPSSRDEVRNHSFTKDTVNTPHLGSVYYSKARRSKVRRINFVFISSTQPNILPRIWRQARKYDKSQHVFQKKGMNIQWLTPLALSQ